MSSNPILDAILHTIGGSDNYDQPGPTGNPPWGAVPKLTSTSSPMDAVKALLGDTAGVVGNVLRAPVSGVESLVGHALDPAGQGSGMEKFQGPQVQDRLSSGASFLTGENPWFGDRPIARALTPVAADIGLDPLTYVGLGVPGKLGELAGGISNPVIRGRVQMALDFLQHADTGLADTNRAIFEAPFKLGKAAIDASPLSPLLDPSAQSVFSKRVQSLTDAVNMARQSGHELGLDIADQNKFGSNFGPAYTTTGEAMNTLGDLHGKLFEDIASQDNPLAKAFGAILKGKTEQSLSSHWDEAFQNQANLRDQYGDLVDQAGSQPASLVTEGFRNGYEANLRGLEGSRRAVADLSKLIPPIDDPVLAGQVDHKAIDALNEMYLIQQRSNEAMSLLKDQGGNQAVRSALVNERNGMIKTTGDQLQSDLEGMGVQFPEEAWNALTQKLRQVDYLSKGLPSLLADLPQRFQTSSGLISDALDQAGKLYPGINRGQQMIRDHLGVFGKVGDGPLPKQASDILGTPIENGADFLNAMGNRANDPNIPGYTPEMFSQLENTFSKAHPADPLVNDPYQMALAGMTNKLHDEMGVHEPAGLMKGIEQGTALWKGINLLAPSFPIQNLVSGLALGALHGVDPGKVLEVLPDNIMSALHGEPVHGTPLLNFSELTGTPIPEALHFQSGQLVEQGAIHDYFGRMQTAVERAGSKNLGIGGGILGTVGGYQSDDTDHQGPKAVLGGVLGAGLGVVAPKASRLIAQLTTGIEYALRDTAYLSGAVEHTQAHIDDLKSQVNRILSLPTQRSLPVPPDGSLPMRTGMGTRQTFMETVPPEVIDKVNQEIGDKLLAQGNLISPDDVSAIFIKNGLPLDKAQAVHTYWKNVLDDSTQAGVDKAHLIHFDYQDLNNFQQFIRQVSPFSTWTMKAYPFFAQILAERPSVAIAIKTLNDESTQEKSDMGLTGRFTGSVHAPAGDVLLSTLLGRPVEGFFNPLKGLVPFSDTNRGAGAIDGTSTGPAQAVEAFHAAGFGLDPAVESALRMTGLLGEAPATGHIRQAGVIKGLTGIDLNAPFTNFENMVRHTAGQEPPNLNMAATLKRIDEMALEQTGKPIGDRGSEVAPYIQAKMNRSGAIWNEAYNAVNQEKGVQSALGYIYSGIQPQALLSPGEQTIREGEKGQLRFDRGVTEELQKKMSSGHGGDQASDRALNDTRLIMKQLFTNTGSNPPPEVTALIDRGTVRDLQVLRSGLQTLQYQVNPLTNAYGSNGDGPDAELRRKLAVLNSPATLMMTDPRQGGHQLTPGQLDSINQVWNMYQNSSPERRALMSQGNGLFSAIVKDLNTRRNSFGQSDPQLADYMAYQSQTGRAGSIPDFLTKRAHAG